VLQTFIIIPIPFIHAHVRADAREDALTRFLSLYIIICWYWSNNNKGEKEGGGRRKRKGEEEEKGERKKRP
jgi:hypothetical protein